MLGDEPSLQEPKEKRSSEFPLQTILSALSEGIVAIGQDESVLFLNQKLKSIVNYGSESKIWEIFRDPEILAIFRSAIRDQQSGQLEFKFKNRVYSVSVSPLKEYSGAVGIFHDVTELKKSDQIRVDFVANVSHELRTPLTAIKGFTDTLTQDVKQGKKVEPEFLDAISRNVERLLSLIGDLLNLSSLESNLDALGALKKTTVLTQEVTEHVISQMKAKLDKKNQKIESTFLCSEVLSDPKRLEQVLINLMDNAHKYTPRDGKIEIVWERNAQNGFVTLKVKDNGPGIAEEHLPRLFERFYRVDEARSRDQGGTGLGLAIVKHILQRHGGSVRVSSRLGVGTEFTCEFPS